MAVVYYPGSVGFEAAALNTSSATYCFVEMYAWQWPHP